MYKRKQWYCLVNDYQLLTTISAVYSSSHQNARNSKNNQQNCRVCKAYVSSFVLKVPRLCPFACLIGLTCGWSRSIMQMLDSVLCQSITDMWSTKWHWDKLISEYFSFPLSVPLQQCSILTFIYMLLSSDQKKKKNRTTPGKLQKKKNPSFAYRWAMNSELLKTEKKLSLIYGLSYYWAINTLLFMKPINIAL